MTRSRALGAVFDIVHVHADERQPHAALWQFVDIGRIEIEHGAVALKQRRVHRLCTVDVSKEMASAPNKDSYLDAVFLVPGIALVAVLDDVGHGFDECEFDLVEPSLVQVGFADRAHAASGATASSLLAIFSSKPDFTSP